MSNHNQHNENTPDKPEADALHLSEEQQSLLTADTLGQLEPGSSEATEAKEIRTGQHRAEADKLIADTAPVAAAIQQIAAEETASLADDPARKEVRQAVLAAIAKNGSVSPASSTDTAGQHKKSNRRIVGWLSGLASLAAVIAVIAVMQPDILQQKAIELQQESIERKMVEQAEELSNEIAMLPAEGRMRSRRAAQPGVRAPGFRSPDVRSLEQQQQTMPAAKQRADGFQAARSAGRSAERSAGIAGDMIASDTSARQSGVKVGGGAMADADESVEPMQSSVDTLAAAPLPTQVPTGTYSGNERRAGNERTSFDII